VAGIVRNLTLKMAWLCRSNLKSSDDYKVNIPKAKMKHKLDKMLSHYHLEKTPRPSAGLLVLSNLGR
jgi:hypothetical protein